MRKTELVTMRVSLSGWFDTGAITASTSVAHHEYIPDGPTGKRLGQREEIVGWMGEIFMTEASEQEVTRHIMKAFDAFTTRMALP